MKLVEYSFREIQDQGFEIRDEKILPLLRKRNLVIPGVDGALLYGFLSHEFGIGFELLAICIQDEYRIAPDTISCSFTLEELQDLEAAKVDSLNQDLFENKIHAIKEKTSCSQEIRHLRQFKDLDPCRHTFFCDDVMVYFLKKGQKPEAGWVRLEKMEDSYLWGTLVVKPVHDDSFKEGDTISIKLTVMEDGSVACVHA